MVSREKAMEALRQLEAHAPGWVKIVREYIAKLETASRKDTHQ